MDKVYQSIGKFIVEFSQLQHMMEFMTILALPSEEDQQSWDRAWSVLSGRTAQLVSDGFFSLCYQIYKDKWTDVDFRLLNSTRKEVQDLIEHRNRIAHDVWSLGHPNYPVPEGHDALRFKYSTSARKGALRSAQPVSILELNALSDNASRLNSVIRQVGLLMRFPPGKPVGEQSTTDIPFEKYLLTEYVFINSENKASLKNA